jgi:hypothetical protein
MDRPMAVTAVWLFRAGAFEPIHIYVCVCEGETGVIMTKVSVASCAYRGWCVFVNVCSVYQWLHVPGRSGRLLDYDFNPSNAELNPTCHLPVLLGAHLILHISRIRVK